MKKLLIVFFIACFTALNQATYKEVLHLYEFQIKSYLNKHNIKAIKKIAATKINPELKSGFWPNHWPFAMGIGEKKAFWVTFKNFGLAEVTPLINPAFQNLTDIAGSKDGEILIADQTGNLIYIYQLNSTLSKEKILQKIAITKPKKIKLSKNKTLAILTDNTVQIYSKKDNSYTLKKTLTENINKNISAKLILDIAFDNRNQLYLLTKESVYVFNKYGRLIKNITLEKSIDSFDVTNYRNIIGMSKKDNKVYLFSDNGLLLESKVFPNFKQKDNYKFIYFAPFSYMGIYNNLEGYAYNMGLDIKEFKWEASTNNKKSFSFTTTFPAKTSISITDSKNNILLTLIDNKLLKANQHNFTFELPNNKNKKNYTLTISGKALYSQSNIKKKTINFTE